MKYFISFTSFCRPTETKKGINSLSQQLKVIGVLRHLRPQKTKTQGSNEVKILTVEITSCIKI